ncbi:hypothetical protein AMC79_PD00794 (plasmid) [Rhizobium phaseoli]|nr:hypothetical protein AMC89_PD00797 [Rhizobium phaseoli]ANM01959.1 hypothetical protein AMC79_PD00794 [Rhizobium phaseoli]
MIAGLILCASLTAVDGDTVKCDGQNMRLLGEGVPFVSGIDTLEIGPHAKCIKERKLALIAKGRLKELLAEKGLRGDVQRLGGQDTNTPSSRQHLPNERGRDREEAAAGGLCQDMEPAAAE